MMLFLRFMRLTAPATFYWLLPLIVSAQTHPAALESRHARQAEWFHQQVAGSSSAVPADARLNAIRQMRAMQSLSVPGANTAPWTSIGPRPVKTPYRYSTVSGRVTSVVVDPRNNGVVYLGGAQGGVWKSVDGGANWTPLTDNQPSLAIGALALDPSDPNTIYAGTGEENFYYDTMYGAGILKSSNAGATWTQLPTGPFVARNFTPPARIGQIAIHPSNGKILLAAVDRFNRATDAGVYRSADGGVTWTLVLRGAEATDVTFDPHDGGIAYAGLAFTAGAAGIYKSTDAGVTWAHLTGADPNTLPTAGIGTVTLAISRSSSSTLYAALQNTATNGLLGLYKTVDAGATWTQLSNTPNYCLPQCAGDRAVGVHPTNPDVVFVGGVWPGGAGPVYRSLDGGLTWQSTSAGPNREGFHSDIHSFAFTPDGGKLYVGNDGGISVTSDVTAPNPNWTSLNATLTLTQFYPGISIHPANSGIGFGGTQDIGIQKYTGSLVWNEVMGCDGGWSAIDPSNTANVYVSCDPGSGPVLKSRDGGQTWTKSNSGINTSDKSLFIPPLIMDPLRPQTLYFGTENVYQTVDGAGSWSTLPALALTGQVTTLAVAPSDSNTLWAGTNTGKIAVSSNATSGGAATWTNVSAGLPPRLISQVVPDIANPNAAYVTCSGFSGFGDSLGHVFVTSNKGANWTDITGNLPNIPVQDLAIDPDAPNTLYLGTDIGVFWTTNRGQSWAPLASGLPVVGVMSLKLHRPSRTLRAATHGRGMWDLPVPSGSAPAPVITEVDNAFSNAPNSPIQAGSWVAIKGTNLANSARGWTANENFPATMDGVSVTINDKPAFLYYISSTQVNVQAPSDSAIGPVNVVLTNNGVRSAAFSAQLQPYSPALLQWGGGQFPYAEITRYGDDAYIGNPTVIPGTVAARPGDILTLWVTGLGPTNPAVPAGQQPGLVNGAFPTPTTPPAVTVGGTNVTVLGAYLRYAGLYQVNIQLPASLGSGNLPIQVIMQGSYRSPANILVAVSSTR